jgi:hypothetical protein
MRSGRDSERRVRVHIEQAKQKHGDAERYLQQHEADQGDGISAEEGVVGEPLQQQYADDERISCDGHGPGNMQRHTHHLVAVRSAQRNLQEQERRQCCDQSAEGFICSYRRARSQQPDNGDRGKKYRRKEGVQKQIAGGGFEAGQQSEQDPEVSMQRLLLRQAPQGQDEAE